MFFSYRQNCSSTIEVDFRGVEGWGETGLQCWKKVFDGIDSFPFYRHAYNLRGKSDGGHRSQETRWTEKVAQQAILGTQDMPRKLVKGEQKRSVSLPRCNQDRRPKCLLLPWHLRL